MTDEEIKAERRDGFWTVTIGGKVSWYSNRAIQNDGQAEADAHAVVEIFAARKRGEPTPRVSTVGIAQWRRGDFPPMREDDLPRDSLGGSPPAEPPAAP